MVLLVEVLHRNADSVERKIPSIPHSSRSTGTETIPLSDASPLQTRFSAQRYQRPLPWITIFLEIPNLKGRHSVM